MSVELNYRREGDMFHLCDGDEILDSMEEVAIGYEDNMETGTMLHKHGSKKRIEEWMKKTVQMYKKAGGILAEDADNIKMIFSSEWDLEELNKMLNITGYIGIFLKKNA